MEAVTIQRFQFSSRIDLRKFEDKPCGSLRFTQRANEDKRLKVLSLAHLQPEKRKIHQKISVSSEVSCSDKNSSALLEIQSLHSPFEKELILQRKAEEIKPYLNERSLYLVGMMGSGKTTVGKLMAKALGYTFLDCDNSIENSMNGTSVAEIFQHFGETFFREKETEALKNLSLRHKVVVSTGGGAVIKPVNWKYMNKGISIWLDVPIEALAHRIAAVGTDSRPLLHDESGDAYTVAFDRLSMIWDLRGERYANASVKICLKNLAAKFRYQNVSDLIPTEIAVEAFEQVKSFLVNEDSNGSLDAF